LGLRSHSLSYDEALGDYSLVHVYAHILANIEPWDDGMETTYMKGEDLQELELWLEKKVHDGLKKRRVSAKEMKH